MLLTVDTGGTKTYIARFDRDGTIQKSSKFPTPDSVDDYVSLLRTTLQNEYSDQAVEALVIALPGTIRNGVAVWCDNLKWKNFDAYSAFSDLFNTPVIIENDANLAGLAEARALTPIPVSSLYVTISTGIGTGFVTNGRIDPGLRHSEGGHMLLEFNDSLLEWEDFASGHAIKKHFGKYAREITEPQSWDQIADRISRGFIVTIPLVQPDVIIIGGSIGTYFEHYKNKLHEILDTKLPTHITRPSIIQAKHPEQAVSYGCYYYALDYLNTH